MKYLICNLKANKTQDELIQYEKELSSINECSKIELIICPSTPFLFLFQSGKYKLGSQDVSKFNNGPYTGETTAEQLSSLNVKYALIGHSERRMYFQEDEETIIAKIKKAYHSRIRPIYFIGETKEAKSSNNTFKILEQQIAHIINEIPDYKRKELILVYEPIWAIGTGEVPSYTEIKKIITFIKSIVYDYYCLTLPVLYGGSVNESNVKELSSIHEIDGLIVGECAKTPQSIQEIYNIYQKNI